MPRRRKRKLLKLFIFSAVIAGAAIFFYPRYRPTEEAVAQERVEGLLEHRVSISAAIAPGIQGNKLPDKMEVAWKGQKQNVTPFYTLMPKLQAEAEKLLKSYKPDYGAIFMMDAQTGQVLVMTSFERGNDDAKNWVLQASFPAASVFKVVTATVAVDRAGILPAQKIMYNGGAYTLYRKNVMSNKITRWTNVITLKDAFARSINTAFGRLSLERLRPEDVNEYANRFMFNQEIPADFPVEMGVAYVPPDRTFEFAEIVSGFNRTNRMSPVQGAMIAASVANEGKMVIPYLIDHLNDDEGHMIYKGETLDHGAIMTKESSSKIRELMEETVLAGTSRKSFRQLVHNKKFRDVQMGGKTGHFTGDTPKGRVDWFVGYAFDDDHRIAVAAITVNKKFWTVKSAHLGQSMFHEYFK
jgi:peptidoglycan glycosyltransferase